MITYSCLCMFKNCDHLSSIEYRNIIYTLSSHGIRSSSSCKSVPATSPVEASRHFQRQNQTEDFSKNFANVALLHLASPDWHSSACGQYAQTVLPRLAWCGRGGGGSGFGMIQVGSGIVACGRAPSAGACGWSTGNGVLGAGRNIKAGYTIGRAVVAPPLVR